MAELIGAAGLGFGVSAGDVALIVGALLVGGCLTGFLAGFLGVGGGGIVVPVLYEVFTLLDVDSGIRMQMAVGTALGVMVPTSLRSFQAHYQSGSADLSIVRRLALPVVVGVMIGSVTARYAHSDTLQWVWVVCGTLIVLKMLFGREEWRLGNAVPRSRALELYAVGIGLVSSLMSVGGGVFVTMMLTLYGRTMQQAVATASGITPVVAIPGMLGFMWAGWGHPALPPGSVGYVSLLGAALMIPAGVLMAPIGARLAHGVSRRTLERAFAALIAAVTVRFLVSLVG